MKTIKLLNILIVALIIIFLALNIFQIYYFINIYILKGLKYDFDFNGLNSNPINFYTKFAVVLNILNTSVILYSLTKLKKLIFLFEKKIYFDQLIINYLKNIGSLFLVATVLRIISLVIYELVNEKNLNNIKFDFVYLLLISLMFFLIGEIFVIAKTQKEENELTI